MTRRRFAIKGTKDFLVLAVFCAFLCVWSVRDAWFPTKKILKKHPREIPVAFSVPGVVEHIAVDAESKIEGKILLAKLYDESYRVKVLKAEAAVKAVTNEAAPDLEAKMTDLRQAHEELGACTLENTDITYTTSHGETPLHGRVIRVLVEPATKVEAGEPVLLVEPTDTFYMFNKTLAVLAFIGMLIALFFHWIATR